jgi:hypothetical protein
MERLKKINVFLMLLLLFSACTENRLKIDVSEIDAKVDLYRIEQDIFKNEWNPTAHQKLYNKFGSFYSKYLELIINAGPFNEASTIKNVQHFREDADMKDVFSDVVSSFSDLNQIHKDFTTAFKYYKYHFPEKIIPQITTYISGFNYALAASDSTLGIGLDMYLGENYKYYSLIGFPQYKTPFMRKEYIVSDAMKGWIATEINFDPIDKSFLEQIVHHGKILYILDAVLPELHDSIKIGYTATQLEWAKNNEGNVWGHFIDGQLLFSSNHREIIKYLNEGPFTPGLPRESPSRIGIWTGWQIVRNYMDRQNEIDLQSLIATDAHAILKESKYKPRR